MTNLSKVMNWEVLEIKTENQLAVWYIDDLLMQFDWCDNATQFYAQTVVKAITDLSTKVDMSAREYEVLLKWVKELEGILAIKSKVWYRYTPSNEVSFEDNLSG